MEDALVDVYLSRGNSYRLRLSPKLALMDYI